MKGKTRAKIFIVRKISVQASMGYTPVNPSVLGGRGRRSSIWSPVFRDAKRFCL